MKVIVLIAFNPWLQSTASANRWLSLIEGLEKLGAKIELLIYGGFEHEKEGEEWRIKGQYKGVNYEYLLPIKITGYWETRFFVYIGQYFRNNKLLSLLKSRFKDETGIFWADHSLLGFKAVIALKNSNTRLKLFMEQSEFLDIHHENKGNFLQKRQGDQMHKLFETQSFFALDGLALMTNTLISHYRSFPQPQPAYLHLPMTVDLQRFSEKTTLLPGFETPYIAFVGVMNDAKDGVDVLIKAFDGIKNKYPKHKLYLVGAWNYDTPAHLQMIKERGLEARVFWMKEYPREQIPAIVGNASLLVLPRPDSKQARGGFPTKLGEYLATGNPVCATSVGELPQYLKHRHSVYFATPGSVDSFTEALDAALSDPEQARTIGLLGRQVATENFNKTKQAKQLYAFFESLLSKQLDAF